MKGNLPFKIDWASLIVGSKLTVFGLFYFIFEGIFPSTSPQRAYIWKGDLMDGFLCYWFGGLIFRILVYFTCSSLPMEDKGPLRVFESKEEVLMCYVGGSTNLKSKSRKG